MADVQYTTKTKEEWETLNPILMKGEIGFIEDQRYIYKIGDGERHWNDITDSRTVLDDILFRETITVDKNIIGRSGISIGQNADIGGKLSVERNAIIKQDTYIGGKLSVEKETDLKKGNLTIEEGSLNITKGSLSAENGTIKSKNATIAEKVSAKNVAASESVTGKNATISQKVSAKNVSVTETITAKNSTVGETSSTKNLSVSNNGNISNKLTVKDLEVTGKLKSQNDDGKGGVKAKKITGLEEINGKSYGKHNLVTGVTLNSSGSNSTATFIKDLTGAKYATTSSTATGVSSSNAVVVPLKANVSASTSGGKWVFSGSGATGTIPYIVINFSTGSAQTSSKSYSVSTSKDAFHLSKD